MIKTIPRRAYDKVGHAIGIQRNGILVFDTEDMTSVMADCCLYDWFENRKNLVQRYLETHPAKLGTDEGLLLNAYVQAKYRILVAQSVVPGAGLYCLDVLSADEFFLMDVALSHSFGADHAALATRTIPLGEYWMTGGAGLPIRSKKALLSIAGRIESGEQEAFKKPGSLALWIVRSCLAGGAADYVRYETA